MGMAKNKKKESTISDKLPLAKSTGTLVFGYNAVIRSIYEKSPKLIILTANFPLERRSMVEHCAKISAIPVLNYPGTNNGLAESSNVHFRTGVIAVVDEGKSDLLAFAEKLIAA